MKKIAILAAAMTILAACTTKAPEDTVLHFEVENMTASQIAVLLDRTTNYMVDLDKNGKGKLVFSGDDLKGAIYPNIAYGQEMMPVYVGAGEEVTIRFSSERFHDEVLVEGKNSAASAYLQSVIYPEIMEYNLDFPAFKQKVEDAFNATLQFMKDRQLEKTCPDFATIEKERLTYLFAQSYIMYPMGYAMMNELEDYVPEKAYFETISELVVEKPELADVDAYRAFIQFAVPIVLEQEGENFTNGYERTLATMKYIAGRWQDPILKQKMLRMLAIDHIQNVGVSKTDELQKLVKAYVTNPLFLQEFQQVFEENNPVANGKISPDFSAQDLEGKHHSLADFLGKYVYIDLWATWCGPCRAELPHLKELEAQFEGKNIQFVGLNVDEKLDDWKDFLSKNELSGTQLWLGKESSFLEDYAVRGIPRFILLDKEGRILHSNMLRPSSEDTGKMLSGLEGI